MQLSEQTIHLLASLDVFSGRKLTRHNDLGILIELSGLHNRRAVFDELVFLAKFASKTYGIMQRSGTHGEGYDNLSREFTGAIEKSISLIDTLLIDSPIEDRQHFTSTYLTMTPESLQRLLALCYDLSWYKNWTMDRSRPGSD
ncbi:MAG TPA: hypothetical protein DGH68_02450 [Bacteroidetes bacterium]|nr:hypothetical protein [Bacteroidota bacterium]